jgi:hypothetical protein
MQSIKPWPEAGGSLITCDYDISHEDVIEGRHSDYF